MSISEVERLREKARHDEAQALQHAEQKGIQKGIQKVAFERSMEIARNLLKMNLPLEQITAATGLTNEEVERLHTEI